MNEIDYYAISGKNKAYKLGKSTKDPVYSAVLKVKAHDRRARDQSVSPDRYNQHRCGYAHDKKRTAIFFYTAKNKCGKGGQDQHPKRMIIERRGKVELKCRYQGTAHSASGAGKPRELLHNTRNIK